MKVSLEWLNELVDISGYSLDDLVNKISMYSIEVEGVEKVLYGSRLVIGRVLTCDYHPNSDHLHICTVDVGTEVLDIVCGAANIKAGLDVIVALEGCELPGGFVIKKSKIRGVESNGMICSLSELGMDKKYISKEYESGIYCYTKEVTPGENALEVLYFGREVIELGLTPNRSDLLSMIGVAYEASAVFDRPKKPLEYHLTEDPKQHNNIKISLETKSCLLYYAKVIKEIKIEKSPDWLISRLIAFGIRPINNAIDITNYILALFGQPLHAFDRHLLGERIIIREATDNEELITIDGIKRTLLNGDVVIANEREIVALGGVMGGLGTSITSETKDVVLEAAIFDSQAIRKTSARLGLKSESSMRFEKGVDPKRTKRALDYACYLYQELCGATICSGDQYQGSDYVDEVEIHCTSKEVSDSLGITLTIDEIKKLLLRLDFKYQEVDKQALKVSIPTRRMDIKIKADLIEEIGRLHGYEKLPVTLPKTQTPGGLTTYQKNRRKLKHMLANIGFTEVVNYTLKGRNQEFMYLVSPTEKDIELMYPLSSERKVLRRELVTSVLENVRYCYNRKMKNCAFFEIGKVYYQDSDNNYAEKEHLVMVLSNQFSGTLWRNEKENADFFLLKGFLDEIFRLFDLEATYEKMTSGYQEMHPMRTASIKYDDKLIGYIGQIHPKYAQQNDLDDVYICEIDIAQILAKEKVIKIYEAVSKVPTVERDISFTVKKEVSADDLVKAIKEVDQQLIKDVIIFDVYAGNKIASDEKSMAIRMIFGSNETLTDEIVASKTSQIIKTLEAKYQAILRG